MTSPVSVRRRRRSDALGLCTKEGLIAEENVAAPDAVKMGEAATELALKYPADDVSLYFSTLVSEDPETWSCCRLRRCGWTATIATISAAALMAAIDGPVHEAFDSYVGVLTAKAMRPAGRRNHWRWCGASRAGTHRVAAARQRVVLRARVPEGAQG